MNTLPTDNPTVILNADNTMTTPVRTVPVIKHSPSMEGHCYAFRKLHIGWINSGMIANDKREIYARYYMAGAPWSSDHSLSMAQVIEQGKPQQEKATAVAYMPYSIEDTNYMAPEFIEADSVEIFPKS